MTGSRNRTFMQVPRSGPAPPHHGCREEAVTRCFIQAGRCRRASAVGPPHERPRCPTVKHADDGEFVTVQWLVRFGMEGKTDERRLAEWDDETSQSLGRLFWVFVGVAGAVRSLKSFTSPGHTPSRDEPSSGRFVRSGN